MFQVELTVAEKIRIILGRKNMTLTDLAEKMNMSRQNLNNKMKRNNFSEKEIADLANALEMKCKIVFISEDGTEI